MGNIFNNFNTEGKKKYCHKYIFYANSTRDKKNGTSQKLQCKCKANIQYVSVSNWSMLSV